MRVGTLRFVLCFSEALLHLRRLRASFSFGTISDAGNGDGGRMMNTFRAYDTLTQPSCPESLLTFATVLGKWTSTALNLRILAKITQSEYLSMLRDSQELYVL